MTGEPPIASDSARSGASDVRAPVEQLGGEIGTREGESQVALEQGLGRERASRSDAAFHRVSITDAFALTGRGGESMPQNRKRHASASRHSRGRARIRSQRQVITLIRGHVCPVDSAVRSAQLPAIIFADYVGREKKYACRDHGAARRKSS
jgi:hypothetical protein